MSLKHVKLVVVRVAHDASCPTLDLLTQSLIKTCLSESHSFHVVVLYVHCSTMVAAGYSNMAQQIGSRRGGGCQPL